MAIHSKSRLLMIGMMLSVSTILAQTTPSRTAPASPCPASGQSGGTDTDQSAKPCAPTAHDSKKSSTSEQFPFPGEPAKPAPAPDSPSPSTTSGSKPSSAAAQHPFPTQLPPKLPGDDSSSSSSSADDPNATPDTPTPAPGTEGSSVHRKLPKPQHIQSDDERVDEDLKVARFYMNDENLPGAYLRAKDAVKVQPDYSATHFTLAQIAQKMKKKDEAIAEYQTYLKLDPSGDKARDAQRALAALR